MLQLSRVLHATDYSPSSRKAMQYSMLLARRLNVPLDILHVVSSMGPYTIAEYVPQDLTAEASEVDRRVAEGFHSLAIPGGPEGTHIRLLVGHGPLPGPVILEEAKSEGANLIVLGAHGSGTAQDEQLGSVAADIIRRSTCPVMIIPAEMSEDVGDDRIERVVTYVTFGHRIDPVILFAVRMARVFGAHLDVLAVATGSGIAQESSWDSIEKHLWLSLEKHVDELPGPIPSRDVQLHTLTGDSVDQVLDFSREHGSDLLIMVAPGLAGPGSPIEHDTEDIVARAPCPVVLLNTCGRVAQPEAGPNERNARKMVAY